MQLFILLQGNIILECGIWTAIMTSMYPKPPGCPDRTDRVDDDGTKHLTVKVCATMLTRCHPMETFLFFIVRAFWSRIIVMHWKQGTMTGTNGQADTPYIYTVVDTDGAAAICLTQSGTSQPNSFDQWFFRPSACLNPHVLVLSIFLSLSIFSLPLFYFIILYDVCLHLSLKNFSCLNPSL